jgi:hypothetical protein
MFISLYNYTNGSKLVLDTEDGVFQVVTPKEFNAYSSKVNILSSDSNYIKKPSILGLKVTSSDNRYHLYIGDMLSYHGKASKGTDRGTGCDYNFSVNRVVCTQNGIFIQVTKSFMVKYDVEFYLREIDIIYIKFKPLSKTEKVMGDVSLVATSSPFMELSYGEYEDIIESCCGDAPSSSMLYNYFAGLGYHNDTPTIGGKLITSIPSSMLNLNKLNKINLLN